MATFRIHHASGHADIPANAPNEARRVFAEKYPGVIIKKVKVLK
jgi:hypothetical protein